MMPITVEWANTKHTVIHYRFLGDWTWDDYDAANQITTDLLDRVDHAVNLICDFTASTAIPPRVLSNVGRSLRQKRPGNLDQIVVVGVNGLLRNLADVLSTLYPTATAHIIFAHTLDHALRLLTVPGKTQR
jgi:hypothetical protein